MMKSWRWTRARQDREEYLGSFTNHVGGESGNETGKHRYRACKIEWIESLIVDLKITSKIFVKQLGTHLANGLGLKHRHGGDITEWPEDLRIRQFPITK